MKINFIISAGQSGSRLDQAVAGTVTDCSRSLAAALILEGAVRVGGEKKRPSYRVKSGESVFCHIPELQKKSLPDPEQMPLSILFEDDWILVVDKPAGLVVHPGAGNPDHTLVNGLMAHVPEFSKGSWDPLRPGIVHRLDKDTSGVMVVAKTISSLAFLQKEFKHRRVEKHYLALVDNPDVNDTGDIELPLGRHPVKRKLMAVNHDTGKYARTAWQVKERFNRGALLDVRLFTGRTHQIRVHFYALGMPLLGDRVYQHRRNRRGQALAPRQMLHSWKLEFRHPYSGRRVCFKSPMPGDFSRVIEKIK